MTDAPILVHLVRHGRVASHRGDLPVTEDGLREAVEAGRRLGGVVRDGEVVAILTTQTRRSRDTATVMREGLLQTIRARGGEQVRVGCPVDEFAIRNPDMCLAGRRVEMVSTPEAMAEQLAGTGVGTEEVKRTAFYPEFFAHPDRIGYWLTHPNPPGENGEAVARRVLAFAASLRYLPRESARRYVCVTHSPILRAFLLGYLLDTDPGEPRFTESVDITISDAISIRFRENETTLAL
jgi:broad specificity phosphatase PhoE